MDQFASTSDDIKLYYRTAMTECLVQMHNSRTSHHVKEILLLEDDASGSF